MNKKQLVYAHSKRPLTIVQQTHDKDTVLQLEKMKSEKFQEKV